MENQPELSFNALHFKAKTNLFVNRSTFNWSVEIPDNSEWCQRKLFQCTEDYSFEIILTTFQGDILIEIEDSSTCGIEYLCATVKMHLVNEAKVVQASASINYICEKSNNKCRWGFPTFFTRNTLKEKNCIQNGFFSLIIDFIAPNSVAVVEMEKDVISNTNTVQCSDLFIALHDDLENMLSNQTHSDITLKAGGVSFRAHKCILSSRSPIFRAMFDCNSLENQTGVVDIGDLDSVTLKSLLKFLYNGTIDSSNYENTLKLVIAADKYQVKLLAEKCADILKTYMELTNVCDIYVVADMLNFKGLKTSALNLIEDHAEEFLSSPEWHEWSRQNGKLGLEIVSNFALHVVKKLKYE